MSKIGVAVAIDDEKKAITFSTPENRSIRVDDTVKVIEITDVSKNKIGINVSGIDIKVADQLKIKSTGDVI